MCSICKPFQIYLTSCILIPLKDSSYLLCRPFIPQSKATTIFLSRLAHVQMKSNVVSNQSTTAKQQLNEQAVCHGRIFQFCGMLIRCELQRTYELSGPGANRLQLIEDNTAQHCIRICIHLSGRIILGW